MIMRTCSHCAACCSTSTCILTTDANFEVFSTAVSLNLSCLEFLGGETRMYSDDFHAHKPSLPTEMLPRRNRQASEIYTSGLGESGHKIGNRVPHPPYSPCWFWFFCVCTWPVLPLVTCWHHLVVMVTSHLSFFPEVLLLSSFSLMAYRNRTTVVL